MIPEGEIVVKTNLKILLSREGITAHDLSKYSGIKYKRLTVCQGCYQQILLTQLVLKQQLAVSHSRGVRTVDPGSQLFLRTVREPSKQMHLRTIGNYK